MWNNLNVKHFSVNDCFFRQASLGILTCLLYLMTQMYFYASSYYFHPTCFVVIVIVVVVVVIFIKLFTAYIRVRFRAYYTYIPLHFNCLIQLKTIFCFAFK